ncbi:YkgJ family cysteine cluster protein [Kamptonema cortianum]|nr:YkgJ family cysteine cluster protein [Oscillatoria laete-virens]MDK3159492.1 YkgJ family cysteine cluster protein [Kamptonema cortianum]MDL5044566.1 YkgJ family cysteine cluster protein [Oscillatoria amoena NRMC-F 0135]MDL5053032.1 YkgJ family cysteine cluster protein [Oscillatoria laete-virens NRMC-F 0139]
MPAQKNEDKEFLRKICRDVESVYDETGKLRLERNCVGRAECCQFSLTGRTPYLTKGEAIVAARAWKATGRKLLPQKKDGSCPFLDDSHKCMIYAARPFGCRTHFCAAAGGPYARKQVIHLIRTLEQIDLVCGGEGALPLETAIEKTGLLD